MRTGTELRLDIQGLRALAVLAVIVFHVNAAWLPGGFLGVDVFFVISGFIVSRVILKQGDRFSWSGFYANRVRRILPAYAAMLSGVALLAAVFLIPGDFRLFEKSLHSALVFISNQHFASAGNYFAPAVHEWPLLHTWSLAIEMQFYFLLPLILHGVPRAWLARVVGAMCVGGFAWAQWRLGESGDAQSMYYAMLARAPEFLMGTWLAVVLPKQATPAAWRQPLGLLGLVLILSAFALLDGSRFSPAGTIWPCLGVLMVIAAQNDAGMGRWLTNRWAVAIGALSYSLYLWHWPVLALTRYVSQDYELSWPMLAFAVAAFSGLAWLSWRFVEQPWLQSKGVWRSKKAAVAAMVVITPLVVAHPFNDRIAPPPSANALRYAPAETICHGQLVGTCERGKSDGAATVLLLGDSHAAQLNLFMDAFGQAHGVRAIVLTASSCVPIPGFEDDRLVAAWAREPCHEMQQAVKSHQGMATLILAGKWSYQLENPKFLPLLEHFLQETDRRKQRVIILGQLPMLIHNPVRSLRLNTLGIRSSSATNPEVSVANAKLEALARGFPRVTYVDFGSSAMFATPPLHEGELIYMDTHHLNENGSLRYAAAVGPQLATLLSSEASLP